MNVIEARRTRQLIIRIERGEELPAALLRALDEAEARAGWIEGIGSLEAAQIALFDATTRTHKTRRLDGFFDVATLSGNVAHEHGETSIRLSATLARETDVGLQLVAGELAWARVYALELRVTVFDDVLLARVPDDRTGLQAIAAQPSGSAPAPAEPARLTSAPKAAEPTPVPAPAPALASTEPAATPMPQRPTRAREEEAQHYPEVGDAVTHFHFGECVVISSDGERIRLRQDRDGRVREVSLTMLRIQPPTVDAETGTRRFLLSRKN